MPQDRQLGISVHERTFEPATVAEIQRGLSQDGYVYLTGIGNGFDYPQELAKLGTPMPQYHGDLICEIRPDPRIDPKAYSALSMSPLKPHTEWYEFQETPPRLLALWCVRAAGGTGGDTFLADGKAFFSGFSPSEQESMRNRIYEWCAPTAGGIAARHPILEESPDGTILRYSSSYLRRSDSLSAKYIDEGQRYFEANRVAISIATNAILIWDNWRMVHGRAGFADPQRHLRRMFLR